MRTDPANPHPQPAAESLRRTDGEAEEAAALRSESHAEGTATARNHGDVEVERVTTPTAPPRTRLVLIAVACFAAACLWWLQQRSLRSTRHTLTTQTAALARMQSDADRIAQLRTAPQRATDRRKPHDDLMAQINRALSAAGVPKKLWQDSIPQAPQRLANTPYTRHTTRLYFERTTLEQVTGFVHQLLEADPSLTVSAIRVTADKATDKHRILDRPPTWRIELAVSYLTYAHTGAEGPTATQLDG